MNEISEAEFDELCGELGSGASRNAPFGLLTTYRVGGPASIFFTADSVSDLEKLGSVVRAAKHVVPVLVLGKGSNLLVADEGFFGLVITLGAKFQSIDIASGDEKRARVSAGGGVALPVLARKCVEAGLSGLEWAVGVPGSLGGGVAMNAGGHGSDIATWLTTCSIFDVEAGVTREVAQASMGFSYRTSIITASDIVMNATFSLSAGDKNEGRAKIAEIVRWRRANQPGGSNAGSVFRNPIDDAAGRLIEAVGAKGLRLGSAEVSLKHANFIQLDKDGYANDVNALIVEVHRRVKDQFGVDLAPEIRRVGFSNVDNGGDDKSRF